MFIMTFSHPSCKNFHLDFKTSLSGTVPLYAIQVDGCTLLPHGEI
jgi:hypothetical protein